MNWSEIFIQLIRGVLGIVFSGLGIYVTYLINRYIKDKELKRIISSLHDLVQKAVLDTYQTYVEALKNKNIFDKEAQKNALERSLNIIKTNMSADVKNWLEANFEDVEQYLKTLIEANIGLLKNKVN